MLKAVKTSRLHGEVAADVLQKYGIFIMHEMPLEAQLIKNPEWNQVEM